MADQGLAFPDRETRFPLRRGWKRLKTCRDMAGVQSRRYRNNVMGELDGKMATGRGSKMGAMLDRRRWVPVIISSLPSGGSRGHAPLSPPPLLPGEFWLVFSLSRLHVSEPSLLEDMVLG